MASIWQDIGEILILNAPRTRKMAGMWEMRHKIICRKAC